jgi:putative tryptophan/tyrosine transport system substrate-binding protein
LTSIRTFKRGRRQFLATAVVVLPFNVQAQPPNKVRIGYLSSNPASDTELAVKAFRGRLHELGYVENRNLEIVSRYADGKFGDLPRLAAELVRLNVDAMFVYGTPASLAAKEATRSIPIVFGGVNDPLSVGLVSNLRKPGGNVTGVTTNNSELSAKRLSLLKEAVPSASRIAVLANPDFKPTAAMVSQMRAASLPLAVELLVLEARTPPEISAAFARLPSLKPDALVVMPDPWLLSQRSRIVELAMNQRVPAMFHLRQYLDVGGFIAYGASYAESFQQGAGMVDKILRGARAGNLPIEQPWRYEVAVNLKAAKALGVKVPQSLLLRADVVIQ